MIGAPRVLLCAGHEPTGRAGLLADVAAVRALGGAPVAVPSAQTAQGRGTFLYQPTPARVLGAQVKADAGPRAERRRVREERDIRAKHRRRAPVAVGDDPASARHVLHLDAGERQCHALPGPGLRSRMSV